MQWMTLAKLDDAMVDTGKIDDTMVGIGKT